MTEILVNLDGVDRYGKVIVHDATVQSVYDYLKLAPLELPFPESQPDEYTGEIKVILLKMNHLHEILAFLKHQVTNEQRHPSSPWQQAPHPLIRNHLKIIRP